MAEPTRFDPATRVETWMFETVNQDTFGRKTYRRLKFNLVSYDGIPERYIEPVSEGFLYWKPGDANDVRLLAPLTDHGRVGKFEFVEGRLYPNNPEGKVHQFG